MRVLPRLAGSELRVDQGTGLLAGMPYLASPNCDDRPPGHVPELLVVHGISLPPGEFGGGWIEQFFTNCLETGAHPYFGSVAGLQVSAHVLVRRDGSVIQFVPFGRRAWHAGESCWRGRQRCNDFSIGIELEGTDSTPYEDAQYTTLARIAVALLDAYPSLRPEAIVGHSDIAPGRKTDPGTAFDWPRLNSLVRQYLGLPRGSVAT